MKGLCPACKAFHQVGELCLSLDQAFDVILTMARAEYNRDPGPAPAMQAVQKVRSQALELITAYHYLNVKG